MREIKFRAWDDARKKMYNEGWYDDLYLGDDIYDKYLMQYTGLKDKNGVEIYSGDILSSSECSYFAKFNKPWIGCVIDDAYGGASITFKDYVKDIYSLMQEPTNDAQTATWIQESCKVIGNIYENPELLDEK